MPYWRPIDCSMLHPSIHPVGCSSEGVEAHAVDATMRPPLDAEPTLWVMRVSGACGRSCCSPDVLAVKPEASCTAAHAWSG